MTRSFRVILLSILLAFSLSAHAAGAGKLIDYLFNDSGLVEVLTKNGFEQSSAVKLRTYVQNSIKGLNYSQSMPTPAQFKKIITELGGTPKEVALRKKILILMDKPTTNVGKEDITEVINGLIYLSNRFTRSGNSVLGCATCFDAKLASHGIKFTMEALSDSASKQILSSNMMKSARDIRVYNAAQVRKLKLGDYSKATISPAEEKSLALAFSYGESKSKKTKPHRLFFQNYINLIKKNPNGANIFDDSNPQLWRLYSNKKFQEEYMVTWSSFIKEVSDNMKPDETPRETWYRILRKKAGDNPVLNRYVDMLQNKNCFFKVK